MEVPVLVSVFYFMAALSQIRGGSTGTGIGAGTNVGTERGGGSHRWVKD
jgi:hypothetical protein